MGDSLAAREELYYALRKLVQYGKARNRQVDHELRTVELTDDEALAVVEALTPCALAPLAGLTLAQELRLRRLCAAYSVEFVPEHYTPQSDLPDGYVAGWVGGPERARKHSSGFGGTIYVGVSLEGESSS